MASAETRLLRECLALPGNDDIRAAVLDDLSTHSGLTPEECVTRCIHWEEASVEEWFEADRTDPSAVNTFYRTTQSWLFDLLWYAYLQAEGFAFPTHVLTLRLAQAHATGRTHLDFGSGVGITSQLFARAGYDTALADVSDSLLEFARHRLARRGDDASFVNLNADAIAPAVYDVITAVDTLVCIDDLGPVARSLHAALRPGGCLIANLYPRPRSPEIGWEVYDDAALPRFAITSAGFVPVARCDTFTVYRSVDPASPAHRLRTVRDRALLTSRARQVLHRQNVRLAAALRGQPLVTF